jgi:hypothetical protein
LTIQQFDLAIWQFGLANRFAKWTKIIAPVFWQKDLAGEQLWFQEVVCYGILHKMVSHLKREG